MGHGSKCIYIMIEFYTLCKVIQFRIPIISTLILKTHFYLFQGLRETKHPYMFVAREGFREMLEVDDAASRTLPILSKLIVPLRAALVRYDCCFVYVCAWLSQSKH